MADFKGRAMVFDVETGGFSAEKSGLAEVAVVVVDINSREIIERYQNYILPYGKQYNDKAFEANGLSMSILKNSGVELKTVVKDFIDIANRNKVKAGRRYIKPIAVAHNADFDLGFVDQAIYEITEKSVWDYIHPIPACTLQRMEEMYPNDLDNLPNRKLGTCCEFFGIPLEDAHSALPDTEATAKLYIKLISNAASNGQQSEGSKPEEKINEFRSNFRF